MISVIVWEDINFRRLSYEYTDISGRKNSDNSWGYGHYA